MKKKATIQDIADALGISRNTVSKAINNSGGLAESTREKILQKAVEMGYKQFSYVSAFSDNPTFRTAESQHAAPSFKGEFSLLSAKFLAPSHFASLMLDKFQREIAQLGYSLNIHRITEEDLRAGRLPITFSPDRSSGIICFEVFDKSYADMLCALDLPILFVDGPAQIDGSPLLSDQLYMDNTTGITQFMNYMIRQGKRSFGWIGDYEHCQSFYERYRAFRTALLMAGIPAEDSFIIREHGMEELSLIFRSMDRLPEVFICANDFLALDAIRILTAMGKEVPGDIRICGFDDSPESRHSIPRITTVHIHTQVMALSAVYLIMSRINEPGLDFRTIYTAAELIQRESSTEGD